MGGVPILRADSATRLGADFADAVVVCGSHGGRYPGGLMLAARCRGAVFHDAGGGRDDAGIASLALLAEFGVPAVAVSHLSARIGDADDVWARGIVSSVNAPAAALGCAVGDRAADAARTMTKAPPREVVGTDVVEQRTLVARAGPLKAWALDSASQVGADDAGAIILTGSHGGLLGGRPEAALKADARFAAFNDAGVGIENAGLGRLAVLAARGMPAATVSSDSARIGEGISTYEDGVVSYLNEPARRLGAREGQRMRELVDMLLDRAVTEAVP